ncbi:MAG TPA: hypothetical protein VHY79_01890 [Rhizomicrobium sp.]|nr:hypothetical protein [Rhizomicrobium sp.]
MQAAAQHAKRPEALFGIIEALILKNRGVIPIHEWDIREIHAVLCEIGEALRLVPYGFRHELA